MNSLIDSLKNIAPAQVAEDRGPFLGKGFYPRSYAAGSVHQGARPSQNAVGADTDLGADHQVG